MMSYEEACKKAFQMRSQGMSYPEIAEFFRNSGYKSPKTGKPITPITVRYMAGQHELGEKQEHQEEKLETSKPMFVTSPSGELMEAVKQILDLDGIPVSTRLRLARELLSGEHASLDEPAPKKRGRKPKNPK